MSAVEVDVPILQSARSAANTVAKAVANQLLGPLLGALCPACGHRTLLRRSGTFPSTLAKAWRLSPAWEAHFVERETRYCLRCKSNLRSRHFASVITREFNARLGLAASSLAELCGAAAMKRLEVAEINGAGRLHSLLAELPHLHYSEYDSKDPAVASEDLLALSYPSSTFDLVLTSDTLEHIPDVDAALREIHRVLNDGGLHIFTIPVVWERANTLCRARLEDGQLVHLEAPSYHGEAEAESNDLLVFWEFGRDVEQRIRDCGYDLRVERDPENPALAVFIAAKRSAR